MQAPANCLTRRQVAHRLECSEMQIVRFEKEGRLHPERVDSRVWIKVEEVVQLAEVWKPRKKKHHKKTASETERRGKLAAQCFVLFAAQKSLVEIVILTECDPLLVREFWEEYRLDLDAKRRQKSHERELEREAKRQHMHDKKEERREVRAFRLREAELLGKAGVSKLPPNPPTSMAKLARDRLLQNGGIAPGPLPGERTPEGDASSR